jgi:heme A synthase
VGEDGVHREGILHGGDDAQAATTAGTGEDIEIDTRRISAAQVHGSGVPAAGDWPRASTRWSQGPRGRMLVVDQGQIVGAVISIVSGWFDLLGYERGGVDPGIVYRHWIHSILAYASTVAYLANFVWRWRRDNRLTGALLSLSILGAILIAVAGYVGGALRSAM